jgi:hypothetical protein
MKKIKNRGAHIHRDVIVALVPVAPRGREHSIFMHAKDQKLIVEARVLRTASVTVTASNCTSEGNAELLQLKNLVVSVIA